MTESPFQLFGAQDNVLTFDNLKAVAQSIGEFESDEGLQEMMNEVLPAACRTRFSDRGAMHIEKATPCDGPVVFQSDCSHRCRCLLHDNEGRFEF